MKNKQTNYQNCINTMDSDSPAHTDDVERVSKEAADSDQTNKIREIRDVNNVAEDNLENRKDGQLPGEQIHEIYLL